jgi:hypothetical protein
VMYLLNMYSIQLMWSYKWRIDANALIAEIDDIIFHMVDSSFYPYFRHVGFP